MVSTNGKSSKMKSFNERCYDLLVQVPSGKVTTYKHLAEALGTKAYRAVGNAMNKNPRAPIVPCHRVIKSDGSIGGFAFGQKKKISMLTTEGVIIHQGKIDLDRYAHRFRKVHGF